MAKSVLINPMHELVSFLLKKEMHRYEVPGEDIIFSRSYEGNVVVFAPDYDLEGGQYLVTNDYLVLENFFKELGYSFDIKDDGKPMVKRRRRIRRISIRKAVMVS